MKRLVLIAFGIMFLLVPATTFANFFCDEMNASQVCAEGEADGAYWYDFDSHGDCVSALQPEFNAICNKGDATDAVEFCKDYVAYVRTCDQDCCGFLECLVCKIAQHVYYPNNRGDCVSDFRANND